MLCLQQFCSVLSNMEEQLSEDQAAVYSALSDKDRYTQLTLVLGLSRLQTVIYTMFPTYSRSKLSLFSMSSSSKFNSAPAFYLFACEG